MKMFSQKYKWNQVLLSAVSLWCVLKLLSLLYWSTEQNSFRLCWQPILSVTDALLPKASSLAAQYAIISLKWAKNGPFSFSVLVIFSVQSLFMIPVVFEVTLRNPNSLILFFNIHPRWASVYIFGYSFDISFSMLSSFWTQIQVFFP